MVASCQPVRLAQWCMGFQNFICTCIFLSSWLSKPWRAPLRSELWVRRLGCQTCRLPKGRVRRRQTAPECLRSKKETAINIHLQHVGTATPASETAFFQRQTSDSTDWLTDMFMPSFPVLGKLVGFPHVLSDTATPGHCMAQVWQVLESRQTFPARHSWGQVTDLFSFLVTSIPGQTECDC